MWLAAVGAALYTQHGPLSLLPCAWCVLQRLVFVAVAAAALLGLVLPGAIGRRIGAGLSDGVPVRSRTADGVERELRGRAGGAGQRAL